MSIPDKTLAGSLCFFFGEAFTIALSKTGSHAGNPFFILTQSPFDGGDQYNHWKGHTSDYCGRVTNPG